MSRIRSYRDLVAWQRAVDLAVEVYSLTRTFPKSELYGVTGQVRRSAVSVAANIAEGYGRSGPGEYLHFLSNARGSLRETETVLIIANLVGFSTEATHAALLQTADDVGGLLYGLTRSVSRSKSRGFPAE